MISMDLTVRAVSAKQRSGNNTARVTASRSRSALPERSRALSSLTLADDCQLNDEGPSSANSSASEENQVEEDLLQTSLFISYSPDAAFHEMKLIMETVRQLKESKVTNIWFDADKSIFDTATWYSERIRVAESTQAVIVFLSASYITSRISVAERKLFVERLKDRSHDLKLYLVIVDPVDPSLDLKMVATKTVDLTSGTNPSKSLYDCVSLIFGRFGPALRQHSQFIFDSHGQDTQSERMATNDSPYSQKKLRDWSADDVQTWLVEIGLKEFYRTNLAEQAVDGVLLKSMTDGDLTRIAGIESNFVRRKVQQEISAICVREESQAVYWYRKLLKQHPKPSCIFIVYELADASLAQTLAQDLIKKQFKVFLCKKSDHSKGESLKQDGFLMSISTHVIFLMTKTLPISSSLFEVLVFGALWLQKKFVIAMFNNICSQLRPAFKVLLGDCPLVDFERTLYEDGLDVLAHCLRPLSLVPGVMLAQSYAAHLVESVRCMSQVMLQQEVMDVTLPSRKSVYISYQLDAQKSVDSLTHLLEHSGYSCYTHDSITSHRQQCVTAGNPIAVGNPNGHCQSKVLGYPDELHRSTATVNSVGHRKIMTVGIPDDLQRSVTMGNLRPHRNKNSDFRLSSAIATNSSGSMQGMTMGNSNAHPPAVVLGKPEGRHQSMTVGNPDGQQSMKDAGAIIVCISQKYLHTDSCIKELIVADGLHRPILPVMLYFTRWPPGGLPLSVRKVFARLSVPVDLSNERFYERNVKVLLERLKKLIN